MRHSSKPSSLAGAGDKSRDLASDMADASSPQALFDADALGASLESLAIDVVRGESTDFMSRWFRSKVGDADLVIWTDGEKRIVKQQLCFYGQVVDWNPIHGTRTGLVVEEELEFTNGTSVGPNLPSDDGNLGEVAETIRFDRSVQVPAVVHAIQMLGKVPNLNDDERSTLIFNLRQSPKLHRNARERAMKAWAGKADELSSTRRPTFWKRLRGWVLGNT